MTKKARAIARSRFDDYLSRREATSGLGFPRDSFIARVVRGRLQQFNPCADQGDAARRALFCFALCKDPSSIFGTLRVWQIFHFAFAGLAEFLLRRNISGFYQNDRGFACARAAPSGLFHVGAIDHSRSARRRRCLGPMERKRTWHSPSFSRAPAWAELRQPRSSEAGRFHEDFLVAASGKKRARTFHDFFRHGESPGRPVCPLLVEQYSLWLRREKCSAKQDCLCDFFASSIARQSRADQQRPVRRYLFSVSPSNSFQHCGSRRQVRIVMVSPQAAAS